MKLFVVAPGGMLGRAWMELLQERGLPHLSGGRPGLDILDVASVEAGIPDDVDVIVNCSAWTDVDGAETYEADATRVNGLGVRILAVEPDLRGGEHGGEVLPVARFGIRQDVGHRVAVQHISTGSGSGTGGGEQPEDSHGVTEATDDPGSTPFRRGPHFGESTGRRYRAGP